MKTNSICLLSMVLALALLGGGVGCGRKKAAGAAARVIKVTTVQPVVRTFRSSLRVQGTVEAKNTAGMAALVGGVIEELFVDEGDEVKAGASLFQTDKKNLENQVQIARDNVKVAAASKVEADAACRQADAMFQKADADYQRAKKLYEIDKAITLDAFERAETTFKQADAGLARAKAAAELAAARETQAASSLGIAEKQLEDSLVKAPFDGVITRKHLEAGEYAKAGDMVVMLEDPSTLEVSFVLAAQHYELVKAGETKLHLMAGAQDRGEAVAYYKSPAVNPVTRTFEVKAGISDAAGFAPGMLCDVEVTVGDREGLGVPDVAVGRRGGQPVVFVAKGGKVSAQPVKTGWSEGGFTELLDADALSGADVVVEGQSFLNDGDPVRLN